MFAELGYDAAGVRDVIRRTDLASGTFYNYFPDKESVFRAVVDESAQEVRRRLRDVRAHATTLEEFVGDAYRAWFAFLVEDQLMFELMQRNAGPIRSLFGDPILGAGVEELLEDLRAAIDRGDVPPLDADYMAGAMAGVALELGVRMAERTPADVDGAARFATELFLGGIERLEPGLTRQWACASWDARTRSSSISSARGGTDRRSGSPPSSGSAARSRPSTSATRVGAGRATAESSAARCAQPLGVRAAGVAERHARDRGGAEVRARARSAAARRSRRVLAGGEEVERSENIATSMA